MRTIHNHQDLKNAGASVHEGTGFTIVEFESVHDYAKLDHSERGKDFDDWTYGSHCRTFDASRKAIGNGMAPRELFEEYLKMRDKLQSVVDQFAGMGFTTKRKRVFREEGAELDIDRMMVGDPACWEFRKRGRKKKLVRLAVQAGYSGAASQAVYIRTAAIATAAADLLARIGYATEIITVSWGTSMRTRHQYATVVNLKRALEALDQQCVLIVGLPAYQRVFRFGALDGLGRDADPGNLEVREMKPEVAAHLNIAAFVGQKFQVFPEHRADLDLQGFFTELEKTIEG